MPTNDKRTILCRRTQSRQHQAGPNILAQRHRTQHDLAHLAARHQHAEIGSADTAPAVTA